jgi:hypothetical protein
VSMNEQLEIRQQRKHERTATSPPPTRLFILSELATEYIVQRASHRERGLTELFNKGSNKIIDIVRSLVHCIFTLRIIKRIILSCLVKSWPKDFSICIIFVLS